MVPGAIRPPSGLPRSRDTEPRRKRVPKTDSAPRNLRYSFRRPLDRPREKLSQTTEQNAHRMIANVNSRDVEKVLEQYAENASFQVPSLDAPIHGKDAIRAFYKESFVAFPDWNMNVTKVIVSGGETIVVNSIRGTHRGPLPGSDGRSFAPTNKRFVLEQLTRVIFDESDKVLSLRSYGNPADVTRQLGLAA